MKQEEKKTMMVGNPEILKKAGLSEEVVVSQNPLIIEVTAEQKAAIEKVMGKKIQRAKVEFRRWPNLSGRIFKE